MLGGKISLSGTAPVPTVETTFMPISFFSRKPHDKPPIPTAEVAQPREISYDPGLVDVLTRQHRDMALLLDKAKNSVQAHHYDDVKAMLDQLRTEIALHMQRETDELHAYLTARIKSEGRLGVLKDMHAGALRTGRAVEGFLKHYAGYPVTERNAGVFYKEIDGVAEEFNKWIRLEESSIYPLYQSPENY